MFLEILSGTKTIFSEGEEDGHLEGRETFWTCLVIQNLDIKQNIILFRE